MIKVVKHGRQYATKAESKKVTCPSCACDFEFMPADKTYVPPDAKGNGGFDAVKCPECQYEIKLYEGMA